MAAGFLDRHSVEVDLRDGTRVRIRPLAPDDRTRLAAGFDRLSPRSRYLRFLAPIQKLTPDMLEYLTTVDYHDHFAWGAEAINEPGRPGIGVARYLRLPGEAEVAEPAVAVLDAYQGRGLGTALLYALAETAVLNGITRFRALVLAENDRMLSIFRRMGASPRGTGPQIEVEIGLPPDPAALPDPALQAALRSAARGDAGT